MFGSNIFISAGPTGKVRIGNRCSFNTGAHILALYGIEIGDDTMVGEYVTIRDQNHSFSRTDVPTRCQGFHGSPIRIGNNVWIGRGVYIGQGVEIGDGCVIAANSAVTKSMPALSVARGVPAHVLWQRVPTVPGPRVPPPVDPPERTGAR